jgi:hypothetical protein
MNRRGDRCGRALLVAGSFALAHAPRPGAHDWANGRNPIGALAGE